MISTPISSADEFAEFGLCRRGAVEFGRALGAALVVDLEGEVELAVDFVVAEVCG